jgi:hypothetical protein
LIPYNLSSFSVVMEQVGLDMFISNIRDEHFYF